MQVILNIITVKLKESGQFGKTAQLRYYDEPDDSELESRENQAELWSVNHRCSNEIKV